MHRPHRYATTLRWTGNRGTGTSSYRAYGRDHDVAAAGRPALALSADPAFRGDASRWNPELMLLAALSSCHQLWYLHLCADAGIAVLAYEDAAEATMVEEPSGAGQFVEAILRPVVTIAAGADPTRAAALHHDAAAKCFIARSVTFPVRHEPVIHTAHDATDQSH